MLDPTTKTDFTRLANAVKRSHQHLQHFRQERVASLRQFCGRHYSQGGSNQEVPVNHILQGAVIYTRSLAAKNPQILATTNIPDLKPTGRLFQQALNVLLDKPQVRFQRNLRRFVFDSLFIMGVAEVGLTDEDCLYEDEDVAPFFDIIDFDDWVHDTDAKEWDACFFMGNKIRLPLDKAKEIYKGKDKDKLEATPNNPQPLEHAASLSKDTQSSSEEILQEMVDLWKIYLPRERLIVKFKVDDPSEALKVEEWNGPEDGPYERLSYMDVPHNVMPLAPVMDWRALHDLSNRVFRKMDKGASNFKEVLLVQDGAAKDAERVVSASHQDVIKVADPSRMVLQKYNGVDANLLGFWTQLKQITSWAQGNTESLGGLEPQSPTLGQDRLLSQQANARLGDMGAIVEVAVTRIIKRLGQYLWYDPLIELPMTHRIGRVSGIEVPVKWTPEMRSGEFLDYNLEIVPYSMQPQSPAQKLQTIMQMLPVLGQLGVRFNTPKLTELLARYAQITDLDDMVLPGTVETPEMVGQPGNKIKSTMERTYRRISQSATPQPSGADQMTAGLMNQQPGANVQAVMGGMR